MNTKLTLSIDRALTEKAKKYARKQGRSLSDLVESYFKVITTDEKITELEVSEKIKSLRGALKVSKDYDYKKELTKSLSKKYK